MSRKYLANVSEVLDGVQKMEESLRRLKRGRDKQNPNSGGSAQDNKSTSDKEKVLSDDDKIRLQLFVDVKHYIQTLESLGVEPKTIKDCDKDLSIIEQLDQLVTQATQSCYGDYIERVQIK